MESIGEVNNMVNKLDFVLQSAQTQNTFQTQNLNQAQNANNMQNDQLKIPEPLPNAFGGMTGEETVFDIQMKALQGGAGNTPSPEGMGDIIDIMG